MPSIIRTETHALATTPAIREDMARTISAYRRIVRMAATVAMTHWPEFGSLRRSDKVMALERFIHPTAKRPIIRYPMLSRALGKMPAYLRRAALSHAVGAVSSFLSNYGLFLDRKITADNQGARPPRLGLSGVYPSLYGGGNIRYGKNLRTVQIKLLSPEGEWRFTKPLAVRGRFKRIQPLAQKLDDSPSLVLKGSKAKLSCPVRIDAPKYQTNAEFKTQKGTVCAIDVGINTAATAVIVDSTGTVIARRFLTCGRHNDQRDKITADIAERQHASGRAGRGFCRALHRRIAGISQDAARTLSCEIAEFAEEYQAKAFVVEDLKGWKPKASTKGQRKRFHRFQHRALIECLTHKAEEMGCRLLSVGAGGTSRWAYDGSGKVVRDQKNAQLAVFSGHHKQKRYNADLNAAFNIAARGLAKLLGLVLKPDSETVSQSATGRSSGADSRMPIVLADVWAYGANLPASRLTAGNSQVGVAAQRMLTQEAPTTSPGGL